MLIAVEIPEAVAGLGDCWYSDTIMAGGCKVESTIWGVIVWFAPLYVV
jgi:hypothetical protein